MYATETKNQFIELRADGLSLDTISSRLNVPRATLGRWHHESIEQIQRLRALQWHLLEEQIGERLEETLTRIAQRIRKWDDKLDRQLTVYQKPGDSMRVIRDSRREYLQLRALLLAPLQPTRGRTACLASLDPHKRDKTRQNPDALDTTALSTNDLQQPEPATSHSAPVESPALEEASPPINTPLQRGEPAEPPATPTASAVYPRSAITPVPQRVAESTDTIPANNGSPALPLPGGEGGGEGQTGTVAAPQDQHPSTANAVRDPATDQSKIQNPQSKSDCGEPPPKKHKPYWLNGHYYQNPEYPEHIARAISPLSAGKGLD